MAQEHNSMVKVENELMNNNNTNNLTGKMIKFEADFNCAKNTKVPVSSNSVKTTINSSGSAKMGSRRIFTPQFKLQVLESYRNDSDCKGNQRATARKYDIHRRQIQKWLQCETSLRSAVTNLNQNNIKHQFHNISHMPSPNGNKATNNALSLDTARHSVALTISSSPARTPLNGPSSNPTSNSSPFAIHTPTPFKLTHTHTPAAVTSVPVVPVPHYLHHHQHMQHLQLHHAAVHQHHQTHHFIPSPAASASLGSMPVETTNTTTGNRYTNTDEFAGFHHYYSANASVNDSNDNYIHSAGVAPIDLSLGPKRPLEDLKYEIKPLKLNIDNNNFTDVENKNLDEPVVPSQPLAEDLTCRKRRTTTTVDDSTPEKLVKVEEPQQQAAKPIKLFKPYLLDEDSQEEPKKVSHDHQDPIIWSNHPDGRSSRGSSTFQSCSDGYPFPSGSPSFPANSSTTTIPVVSPSVTPTAFSCPKGSPVSGYESSSSSYSEPASDTSRNFPNYSVDFKIQPNDNGYYYDALRCHSNAQLSSLSLHRNHVQRWLDQETDIRQGIALYV